jgi:hypothetical protein
LYHTRWSISVEIVAVGGISGPGKRRFCKSMLVEAIHFSRAGEIASEINPFPLESYIDVSLCATNLGDSSDSFYPV